MSKVTQLVSGRASPQSLSSAFPEGYFGPTLGMWMDGCFCLFFLATRTRAAPPAGEWGDQVWPQQSKSSTAKYIQT